MDLKPISNPFEKLSQQLTSIENLLKDLNSKPETILVKKELGKFINIEDFRNLHPKRPARATLYSQICTGRIPKELVYKPVGNKILLFHKDLVLDWISRGMPSQAQQAKVNVNNCK